MEEKQKLPIGNEPEDKAKDLENNPIVKEPGDDTKTYTKEDLEILIKERATELTNTAIQDRLKKEKLKHEVDKADAIKEALRKEKLSKEEQEAEELTVLRNKVKSLNDKIDIQTSLDLIKTKFATHNLPYTEELINVLAKDLDSVDNVIEGMETKINESVSKQVTDKLKNSNVDLPGKSDTLIKKTARKTTTAGRIGVV